MKVFYTVLKVIAALAVVAGIVYVVATYGDKIVSWAKNLIETIKSKFQCKEDCFCEDVVEDLDFEG